MTTEELVREAIDAFNRFDREAVEKLLTSDFELVSPMADIRGGPYKGHAGAHQWVDDLEENFESLELTVEAVDRVRGDRYLVLGRARIEGRTSGLSYDERFAWVMDLRDERIRRVWLLFDQDEARRLAPTL